MNNFEMSDASTYRTAERVKAGELLAVIACPQSPERVGAIFRMANEYIKFTHSVHEVFAPEASASEVSPQERV